MSVLDLYRRSAQRRLDLLQEEVREEPWKVAHREAEACGYFELATGHVLEMLHYFREIEKRWRTAVYRGTEPPGGQKTEWLKEGFVKWLDLARVMDETIRSFEQRGYDIDCAENLRQAIADRVEALANWNPPLPARSPAMRVEDISEEEADALRAILDAPAGSPGKLKIEPLQLPEGDPSLLR